MNRVLSYGAGVDSFAMLLESLRRGEKPDVVAMVDVADPEHQDPGEWPETYAHVDQVVRPLCAREGIPFEMIDSTRYPVRDARSLFAWLAARKQIPVSGPNRICTAIAKVERFEAWARDTFGGEPIEVWIGFEAGEEARAAKDPNAGKASSLRTNRFPLMEWRLCRCRAEQLIEDAGYPVPPKSACVFCPYATRGDFQRLSVQRPELFGQVVELEAAKPLTKNGAKLSIKNFRTVIRDGAKVYLPTLLPDLVAGTYRPPKRELCKVCGELKALKQVGCREAA